MSEFNLVRELWLRRTLRGYKTAQGAPPLNFSAKAGALRNYRIYGNTVNGESVGELVSSGEHEGEYCVPVTVSGKNREPVTTTIYLPEPLRMVGEETEYVDYEEQKQHRVRKNLFNETIYNKNVKDNTLIYVPIYVGNVDYVTCSTTCPKTIYSGNDSDNSRYIFIFSGNVNTGAKNDINGVSNGAPRTIQPSNGYVTICYRKIERYNVRPWEYQTMLNVGSTPLTYEPYIENTDLNVTLPALPTLTGTNTLSVGTAVQPSKVKIKYKKG